MFSRVLFMPVRVAVTHAIHHSHSPHLNLHISQANLVGAAIGNGCTGTAVGVCDFGSPARTEASVEFYFGGGFFSQVNIYLNRVLGPLPCNCVYYILLSCITCL